MAASILAGIRLSRRRTSTFTHGLSKIENVIVAAIGVIVLVLAYEFGKLSITHLSGKYVASSRLE